MMMIMKGMSSKESVHYCHYVTNRMKRYWKDRNQAEELAQLNYRYKPFFVPSFSFIDT